MTATMTLILALLTMAAQALFAAGLIYFLIYRRTENDLRLNFIKKQGIKLAFLVALLAVSGSLFYSEIAGYAPCDLCWFQRIFMYPQVIILGLAIIKKERRIIDYSLALAVIGWLIALYHNYAGWGGASLTVCTAAVSGACLRRYVFAFGYITIPLMSLTAFSLLILILAAARSLFKKFNS